MNDDSAFKLLITDLATRFRTMQTEYTLYSNCTQCGRELEDETSRIIGRGPICRKGERMRFTVLPGVWPRTKKVVTKSDWTDEEEWEEIEVGFEHPDLLHTMDEQADELDLDFILLAGHDEHCLYLRQKKPPFNWINTTENPDITMKEMRTLLLVDYHEYIPHTLIHREEYAAKEWPNQRNMWNCLVILASSQGLWLRRRDACAPSYDHWEEVDDPVCNGCKEWYRETYDGGTRPGLRFLENRFNECPQCFQISYDDDDELVYLGDLTIEDMLRGDGEISNPYHPGHLQWYLEKKTYLTAFLRYSIFQEAVAWELSGGSSDWDDDSYGHSGTWRGSEPRSHFPSSLSTHETKIWTRICEGISEDCTYGMPRMRTEWEQAMGEPMSWRDKVHRNLVERIPSLTGIYQFDMIWWMIPDGGVSRLHLGANPIFDIDGNFVERPDIWDEIIHSYMVWSLEDCFDERITEGNEGILGNRTSSASLLDLYGDL